MKTEPSKDMWSVGKTLFNMATGKYMFDDLLGSMKKTNPDLFDVKSAINSEAVYMFGKKEVSRMLDIPENVDKFVDTFMPDKGTTPNLKAYLEKTILKNPEVELNREQRQNLNDLLLRIFKLDPQERISAAKALEHPFFKPTESINPLDML